MSVGNYGFLINDRDQVWHILGVSGMGQAGWMHMAAVMGPGGMRIYHNGQV